VVNNPVKNIDPDGLCTFTLSNGQTYKDDNAFCAEATATDPDRLKHEMEMLNAAAVEHLSYVGLFLDRVARDSVAPVGHIMNSFRADHGGEFAAGAFAAAMVARKIRRPSIATSTRETIRFHSRIPPTSIFTSLLRIGYTWR
jgi:hypothetical protein